MFDEKLTGMLESFLQEILPLSSRLRLDLSQPTPLCLCPPDSGCPLRQTTTE